MTLNLLNILKQFFSFFTPLRKVNPMAPSLDDLSMSLVEFEGRTFDDFVIPTPDSLTDLNTLGAPISAKIEGLIPSLLNNPNMRETWDPNDQFNDCRFERYADKKFPDSVLRNIDTHSIQLNFEIKTWFACSSEWSSRFQADPDILNRGDALALFVWVFDGVISGSPRIEKIYLGDAFLLAMAKDLYWSAKDLSSRGSKPGYFVRRSDPNNRESMKCDGLFEEDDGTYSHETGNNFGRLDRINVSLIEEKFDGKNIQFSDVYVDDFGNEKSAIQPFNQHYDSIKEEVRKLQEFQSECKDLPLGGKKVSDWINFIYDW